MQHLEGSGTPVLYIGRTVLKGYNQISYSQSQPLIVCKFTNCLQPV